MIVSLLALLVCAQQQPPPPREAEAERPTVRAVRLEEDRGQLDLDGRLEEAAWWNATPATGFRQREPLEGVPATEETEVRVLYDADNLYIGILARDREPDAVIARILQRDKLMVESFMGHQFAGDDGVAILLDPFRDRKNAVVFATNPNGAEFEAVITDENPRLNVDWRAVWSVRAARTREGWSAELSIPFRTLRYPGGSGSGPWGFNVFRFIRRKNEETLWAAWTREEGGFHRVSRAGDLVGLEQLPRRGLNIELKPYGLAGVTQERDPATAPLDTDLAADAGFDLKWEVHPGLVLDATLNPDFAQVEADAEQVNLTRFDLYFPEKRDFFLENAGVFDFGARGVNGPPPFLLFFSRSIGISEDEEEIPVRGGVRLSGRLGRQTLGFLDVVTGSALGEPVTNYGVLRVKRDVGGSNYVGAIVTDRRREHESNTAAGLDASLWPTGSLNLQAFVARTFTTGPGGDDNAYRLAANYSSDRVGFVAEHLTIGPEATAEMGFITRTDIRQSTLLGWLTTRPTWGGLRKIELWGTGSYITRLDGEKQDVSGGSAVALEWDSGDSLVLYHNRGSTRLDEAFDLSDRVPVPVGDYGLTHTELFGGTSASRLLAFRARASWQEIYDGRISSLTGGLRAAPGSHLSLNASLTRNRADLPGGSFTAYVSSLRLTWAFSTRLTAGLFVQHNSLDRKVVTNFRLNFIHRPGSDLFLVLNEERGSETSASTLINRGFALKLTYLARLF